MWNKQDYIDAFSKVTPSPECCQEVMNMTGNNKRKSPVRKSRITRNLLIAAILAGLLAVTASAIAVFRRYQDPEPVLEAAFGENGCTVPTAEDTGTQPTGWVPPVSERVPLNRELAQTLVAPYLCAVEQTITQGDYTLTVEAYTYDVQTHAGLVYYRLKNPNGLQWKLQADGEVWHPEGEPVSFGHVNSRSYLVPELSDGQAYTAVAYFYAPFYPEDAPEKSRMEPLTISLRDCSGNRTAAQSAETLSLVLEGFGGSLEPMPHISLENGQITLTPISIRMSDRIVEELNQNSFHQRDHLKIRYRDGSEYVVRDAHTASYACWSGDFQGFGTTSFTRIVDIQNVESIVVGTAEIPVAPERKVG